jgi:hypothetical protein
MARHGEAWSGTNTLAFEGRSWPAARVVERRNFFDLHATPVAEDLKPVSAAFISTSGRGRPWSTVEAVGFWRSFAEIQLEDDAAIEDFVQRHGDLNGQLSPKKTVHTGSWKNLQAPCQIIASAWEEPDAEGVSRCQRDLPATQHALLQRHAEKNVLPNTKPILDMAFGIRLKPVTLSDFMFLSALTMFYQKTPLRRCVVCQDWMSFSRLTAKTCSTACRGQLSRQSRTTGTNG